MTSSPTKSRVVETERLTSEVNVQLRLDLDGTGMADIDTGLPFLDHMLGALTKHSRMDLILKARGDLHIDDHHTAEDCALTLGRALNEALGNRGGIQRFAYAFVPLDEALARCVVDLSGRPWPVIDMRFQRESIGTVATENLTHFMNSLAIEGRFSLHVNVLCGSNDHHKAEASFKALAVALRDAIRVTGTGIPSTKGSL